MGVELLNGVREKVIRAREHLEIFESEVTIFAAAHPYSIRRHFEDHIPEKSGRPGLTWRASVDAPPPPRLSVFAGDCLQNLRASLDHLAWALVLENAGIPSEREPSTHFPILDFPTTKKGKPKNIAIRATSGGVSASAQALASSLCNRTTEGRTPLSTPSRY